MGWIADLLPVALFFAAYKFYDIYVATGVIMVAMTLQLVLLKLRGKTIETMHWASLALVLVFGGATLVARNPLFIQWKPSIFYGLMALALEGGSRWRGEPLLKKFLGGKLTLPDPIWARLNRAWSLFFAAAALINLMVAYSFDEATWVSFKLFGLTGMTLVFVIAQSLMIAPHLQEEEKRE